MDSAMTINKSIIAQAISAEFGIDPKKAAACIDSIVDLVKNGVNKDGQTMISGFGRFEKKSKAERKGRNPATGEDLMLPPRNVVSFYPSRCLLKSFKNTN